MKPKLWMAVDLQACIYLIDTYSPVEQCCSAHIGVEKKSILLYVNSNQKKCDALQEALALLISSEKSHSSCWNYRCPQRPGHHVFSKQERAEFWPTNPATPITKTTIVSASLVWRRARY